MKNCMILGFGRSGTSLMGGILYHSGYYMGDDLYPSRESNPMGFFENDVINGINEKILSAYDFIKIRTTTEHIDYKSSPYNPLYGQRWLSYIGEDTTISCDDEAVISEIRRAVAIPSFAYKDPRFNYTLPIWKKYLTSEVVYICMFRQPGVTAESVIKDCKSADYLADFNIDHDSIFKLWYNSYQRVLRNFSNDPGQNIIFVHYEQLLTKKKLPELSEQLGIALDDGFITPDLNRSRANSGVPQHVSDLYETLCRLSGFH